MAGQGRNCAWRVVGRHNQEGISESVFFIPIITPTAVRSSYCKFEFESFLAREKELDRNDLIFPILYVPVPALTDDQWRQDPLLSIIASRQYEDWQNLRHLDASSNEAVALRVQTFCANICRALRKHWLSPQERQQAEARQREEDERRRQEAENKRRSDAAAPRKRRQDEEEGRRQKTEDRFYRLDEEAEERRRDEEQRTAANEAQRQKTSEQEPQQQEPKAERSFERQQVTWTPRDDLRPLVRVVSAIVVLIMILIVASVFFAPR